MSGEEETWQIVAQVQNFNENNTDVRYNFHLLSLESFAFSAYMDEDPNDPFHSAIPDLIGFGDGMFSFSEFLGFDEHVHNCTWVHEFGNHIIMELRLPKDTGDEPEDSRFVELLADTFAACFIAHTRKDSI